MCGGGEGELVARILEMTLICQYHKIRFDQGLSVSILEKTKNNFGEYTHTIYSIRSIQMMMSSSSGVYTTRYANVPT